MSKEYAKVKIKINNGKGFAKVRGTQLQIVEALALILIESPDLQYFFKAAIEVSQLHENQKQS